MPKTETLLPEGPFETREEATLHPAVQEIYEAANLADASHRMLCEALSAAGVEPGQYDHSVILWLARSEPQVCAVVAGLITRASRAEAPARADERERVAREILEHKTGCAEHPMPLPKPSCWICVRDAALHKAARVALGMPYPASLPEVPDVP